MKPLSTQKVSSSLLKVVADAGAQMSTSKVPWVRILANPSVRET